MSSALLLLVGSAASAEEDFEAGDLGELLELQIDIGSLSGGETLFSTPSTVSLISRDAIERYNFQTVSEALRTLAGVNVMRTNLSRNIPTIRGILQEHYATKVLVLIDGTPAWNAVTGDGSLDRIDIRNIERIEILKGPASVVYGTNAYAGAVNLVMRKVRLGDEFDEKGNFTLSGAPDPARYGGGGSFSYTEGSVMLALAASAVKDAGFPYPDTYTRLEDGAEVTTDGFFNGEEVGGDQDPVYVRDFVDAASITARLEADFFGTHSFLYNGFQLTGSYLGRIPTPSKGAGIPYEQDAMLMNYTYTLSDAELGGIRAGINKDTQRRDFSRKEDDLTRTDIRGDRLTYYAQGWWHATDWLTFEAGVDSDKRVSEKYATYRRIELTQLQDHEMSDLYVQEVSMLAQVDLKLEKLIDGLPLRVLTGARMTQNPEFDSNLSLRSTLVYGFSARQSLKLVFGQAFRAPTLYEQFFQDSKATNEVYGNPELKPETHQSFELVYMGQLTDHLFMQVAGYYSQYSDKIFRVEQFPDNDRDDSQIYANGDTFLGYGGEAEISYSNPEVIDFFMNYALTMGDEGDRVEGSDHWNFKYIPQHTFSLGLARQFGSLGVSALVNYLHEREGPLGPIGADATGDVTLSYANEDWGNHRLSVKNVTDQQTRDPDYSRRTSNFFYSGEGRSVIYTFSYDL